jgi:hypothetical protein
VSTNAPRREPNSEKVWEKRAANVLFGPQTMFVLPCMLVVQGGSSRMLLFEKYVEHLRNLDIYTGRARRNVRVLDSACGICAACGSF